MKPDSKELKTAAWLIGILAVLYFLPVGTVADCGETGEWFGQSWSYAKQIIPLLVGGVLVAGFLLGRPGHEGLVSSEWIASLLGGNSLGVNAFASVAGSL